MKHSPQIPWGSRETLGNAVPSQTSQFWSVKRSYLEAQLLGTSVDGSSLSYSSRSCDEHRITQHVLSVLGDLFSAVPVRVWVWTRSDIIQSTQTHYKPTELVVKERRKKRILMSLISHRCCLPLVSCLSASFSLLGLHGVSIPLASCMKRRNIKHLSKRSLYDGPKPILCL